MGARVNVENLAVTACVTILQLRLIVTIPRIMICNKKTLPQLLEPIFERIVTEYPDFYSQAAFISGEFAKHATMRLLEQSLGNVSEAARQAKMPRESLWNIINLHGIDPSVFVSGDTLTCPAPTENPQ